MAKGQLRQDEWLADLEAICKTQGDEGATVREIAAASGKTARAVTELLKTAKVQGRVIVGRGVRTNLADRQAIVPVYRIRPAK